LLALASPRFWRDAARMSLVEEAAQGELLPGLPRLRKRRAPRPLGVPGPPGDDGRGHSLIMRMNWDTPEGRLLIATVADLTAHVGGHPNRIEKMLIERASRLNLFIELMDRQALEDGTMSERNSRQYLAWVNALRLCLRELGIKEAIAARPLGLDDIVNGRGER
jgi:hypothetical protein